MVGQTRIDDALDASRLDASGRLRLEIEDRLSGAQNCARFRILNQRIDDSARLMKGRRRDSSEASFMQIGEDAARTHRLFDQLILIRVEQVGDEARVLVHDVRPERRHFGSIELGFPARQRFQPPRPTFGLMLCVVEEERPDEAAQFAAALRVAESGFVVDEWLDLLHHVVRKSLQFAALRRSGTVNLLVEGGEVSEKRSASARSFAAISGGISKAKKNACSAMMSVAKRASAHA